jgi:cytochrome c oxidase cbb3-type subunit 3
MNRSKESRRVPALLVAIFVLPLAAWAGSVEDNYRLYCVQCHGSKGNGEGINNTMGGLAVSPRDHGDPGEMSKLSDEDIRLAVTEGGDAVSKSELMPAWGDTLKAKEIDDLVGYLRKLCKCVGPR